MTKNLDKNVDVRAKRNEYIWQLEQLAAKMEKNELNKSVTLDGSQNGNKQIHLAQHRIQAGKIIFDAYQSGEFHGDGTLCKILDHWSKSPGSEFADWRYIQGFNRFVGNGMVVALRSVKKNWASCVHTRM